MSERNQEIAAGKTSNQVLPGVHHHASILETSQNVMNRPTMSIAIRHGLRLPVPIPKACAALRDVCFKVAENDEKLSPYDEQSSGVSTPMCSAGSSSTHRIVQHTILPFCVVINV